MKVGQALGAMSDRLAVQYEVSRDLAQRCRDGDELGGPVPPSCFSSCIQPSPLGMRSARTGWQGGMKAGGTRRRQAGGGERINIGRICAGRAGPGAAATI